MCLFGLMFFAPLLFEQVRAPLDIYSLNSLKTPDKITGLYSRVGQLRNVGLAVFCTLMMFKYCVGMEKATMMLSLFYGLQMCSLSQLYTVL